MNSPGSTFRDFSAAWDVQIQEIKNGALWPYVKNEDIYRCPTGAEEKL